MTLPSFYRAVALATLWTLASEFALCVFDVVSGHDLIDGFLMNGLERWPGVFWPPIVALILFLTVGGIVLWLGMIWECLSAPGISMTSKVLWLILLVPTVNFGAVIYYFCVFRHQHFGQAQPELEQA